MSKHSQHGETIRDKWAKRISDSNMLHELVKFSEGKIEMSAARANVILRLIGKILPDLQSVEVSATVNHVGLNRLELESRLLMLGKNPKQVWDSLNGQNKHTVLEHVPDDCDQNDDDESQAHVQNNDTEKIL